MSDRKRRTTPTRWPRQFGVRLDEETGARIDAIADGEDRPAGDVLREIVQRYIGSAEKAASGRRSGAARRAKREAGS